MKIESRFALALAACAVLVAAVASMLFLTLRGTLPAEQQSAFDQSLAAGAGALFFVWLLIVALMGMALRALFRRYVLEPRRLSEEAQVILSANPAHRVAIADWPEGIVLGQLINAFANRIQSLEADSDARIAAAHAQLEQENTRLATLMSQLTESVIVCNISGRVLLYNARAQRLFSPDTAQADGARALLGLGRSLFTIMDRHAVSHALEDLQQRLDAAERDPVSTFISSVPDGRMIRVRMAPIVATPADDGGRAGMSGFILVVYDVTRELDAGASRDERLSKLIERARAGLASIGAAVENLTYHPAMDTSDRRRFLEIISEETAKLAGEVTRASAEYRHTSPALATICGTDLLSALKRSIEARAELRVTVRNEDASLWMVVDRFMIVDAITGLAARLHKERGVASVELALERHSAHAQLDVVWQGAPLTAEVARAWQKASLPAGMVQPAESFEQVVRRHAAEAWYRCDEATNVALFRVLLPVCEKEAPRLILPDAPSRPTFYDFDLFHQPGQSAELDECALVRLSYTVFDTETTGLAPSQGDEIVSIGAVRIVNAKLLAEESFEQFVNPRRRLPALATRVHGITDEMVQKAPPIERALPAFHRFCEDTVLVAHNAGFDMRFLQLKESDAGVRFDQPVLDTLMLSAVVYPSHSDHTLEAIAGRLGIPVVGRHTALGDALLTAEVFLRMLPLLAAKGISTLGEARKASSHTSYARLAY